MKAQELASINQELQGVGAAFCQHIETEVNSVVAGEDKAFEGDFQQLKGQLVNRLDELIQSFSVAHAYSRATSSHPRNATAPLLAVLVEAFYYLANDLEEVLVENVQVLVSSFFQRLIQRVRQSEYYSQLYRMLGNEGGIEQQLEGLEEQVKLALMSEARTECDRYVRESPSFYDEGTFYQLRQTLQQTSQGYDCETMIKAEPAIRQLLKLDFEPKISATIRRHFRQTINQTLKTHLLPMAEEQKDAILQQYAHARAYLEPTLEEEAEEKIRRNKQLLADLFNKIIAYDDAVKGINQSLQALELSQHQLPAAPALL